MFKCFFLMVVLLGSSVPSFAQSTIILLDTSKAGWNPSPDDAATFGNPPQPVVTSYKAEVYLKSAVTSGVPSGTPAFNFDWGKPTPDVNNIQSGPLLKPLVLPNTEYFLFLRAAGPGGVSPLSAGIGPFGFPSAPRTAVTPRIIP